MRRSLTELTTTCKRKYSTGLATQHSLRFMDLAGRRDIVENTSDMEKGNIVRGLHVEPFQPPMV